MSLSHAHRPPAPRAWPWLILLSAGTVWGVTFSLAREATSAGADGLAVNLCVTVVAAALLLLCNLLRRRPVPLNRECLRFYAIAGILGTVLPNTLYFYSASRVSAGVLSISIAVVPILTFVLALPIGLDRYSTLRMIGVATGALAVLLLVVPQDSLAHPGAAGWVLLAVLSGACYAAENIFIALRLPAELDPVTALVGMHVMAVTILLPVVILIGVELPLLELPWNTTQWSIVAMAPVTVACYALFIYLINSFGPVFASQMAYVVTVSGVLWGIAIFGESHSLWVWLSLAAMLTGVALVKPRAGDDA